VAAVLAVALLVGWLPHQKRNKEVDAKAKQQQNSVPIVEVQSVHGASAERDLTLPGTVTPLKSAHIYAQASGFLKARYVDLGDTVRKGQLLALISAPELDAMVAQQTAMLQQSKDGVLTAQAALRLQQATYDRVHPLVLHGILSKQEDDTALAAVESAQSNLEAAKNAVKAAQAAQAHAQSMADFEQVRSPIDGTVTARNVEVGSFVSASGGALGTTPVSAAGFTGGPPTGGAQGGQLFDVVDLRSLEIFVAVPEQDGSEIFRDAGTDIHGQGNPQQRLSKPAEPDAARRGAGERRAASIAARHVRLGADALQGPEPGYFDPR
jgi:multidrug efflux pump subunit AcrA (membrane-fusion protein)